MKTRWLKYLAAISVAVFLGGCGGGSGGDASPKPEPLRIEIISDRSFILSGAGDTAQLRARVIFDDGSSDPSAEIEFTSSNPDLIEVDTTGRIRALSDEIGSADIFVAFGDLTSVFALVAIANLSPGTLNVENDWLVDAQLLDADAGIARVVLVRNEQTEVLESGDILISGDLLGLLDEIIEIVVEDDKVVLRTRPASLFDAFDDVLVESRGPPLKWGGVLDGDSFVDHAGKIIEPAIASPGDILTPAALLERQVGRFKCELDGSIVDINLSGPYIEPEFGLEFVRHVEKRRFRATEQFDVYVKGHADITARVGKVELSGGISASVDCKVAAPSIPLGVFPILGPVVITPSLQPALGLEGTFEYKAGSLVLEGPSVQRGKEVRLGVGYTMDDGFRLINDSEDRCDGFPLINDSEYRCDGVRWSDAQGQWDQEFSGSLMPYLKGTISADLRLSHWELASAGLIDSKVGAGAELKIQQPLDQHAADYTGPRWEFFAKASAGLDPMLDTLKPIERLFDRVIGGRAAGISNFIGLNVTLIEFKGVLLKSPEAVLQVAPASVEVEEVLSMQLIRGGSNLDVDFVAIRQDAAPNALRRMNAPSSYKIVARSTTDSDGNASATWVPEVDDLGTYEINVRLNGLFSAAGFPYAAVGQTLVDVTGDVALSINPSGISAGEVGVSYDFNLNGRRIPPNVQEVTFDYTWGDGNTGSAEAVVDQNGEARTTISHAYGADGAYGIVVTLSGGGDRLATRNALVTIGNVRERQAELNICDVWKAAQQGGQGVTVDNWDITDIPLGAVFDMRFNAYSIPDKFIVEYPAGSVVLDTGWRGASSYEGRPLYPGGIAGPGSGQVDGFFTRSVVDDFKVTAIGPQSGTAWRYDIRCRIED